MPATAGVAGRTDGNLAATWLLTEMRVLSWYYHKCVTNCSFSFSLSCVSFCLLFPLFQFANYVSVLSLNCVKSIISSFVISQFEIMSMCITAKYYAPPTGHYYLQQRTVRDAVLMFDL